MFHCSRNTFDDDVKYPRLCYRHFFNLVSYSMLSMVTSENTKNIRSQKSEREDLAFRLRIKYSLFTFFFIFFFLFTDNKSPKTLN